MGISRCHVVMLAWCFILVAVPAVSSFSSMRPAPRKTARLAMTEKTTGRDVAMSTTATATTALLSSEERTTTLGEQRKRKRQEKFTSSTANEKEEEDWVEGWKSWIPPPPEDDFIIKGDIVVLCLYAITSHSVNNWIVNSVLAHSSSMEEALAQLNPTVDAMSSLQAPVWIDGAMHPHVLQSVWKVQAQDTMLDHWSLWFSSAGSAWTVLSLAWLFSGWIHRAFLYEHSLHCETSQALMKTFETWLTTVAILLIFSTTSQWALDQLPASWQLFLLGDMGTSSHHLLSSSTSTTWSSLTKADTMFLIDSATVLFAWRYIANSMMKFFF